MKRYLALFLSFAKASFQSELEYRMNFISKIVMEMTWYFGQIMVFEVLYSHVDNLWGWTLPMVRVFMGCLFVVDSFWMFFFEENFGRISEKIKDGELDLLLTKPIDSQFMMSMQRVNISYVLNIVGTISYFIWAVSNVPTLNPLRALWIIPLIPMGLAAQFAIRTFVASMSLIFVNAENLQYIWYNVYRFGTRPDALYPAKMRLVLMTIFPVAFLASVPARFVLAKNEPWLLPVCISVIGFFIWFARWTWMNSLKRYTSASS